MNFYNSKSGSPASIHSAALLVKKVFQNSVQDIAKLIQKVFKIFGHMYISIWILFCGNVFIVVSNNVLKEPL